MEEQLATIVFSLSIFSKKQIAEFSTKAIDLNKNDDGDQACFYLYKP